MKIWEKTGFDLAPPLRISENEKFDKKSSFLCQISSADFESMLYWRIGLQFNIPESNIPVKISGKHDFFSVAISVIFGF